MSESSDSAKEGARSLPFIKREPDKVVSSGQSEGTMKVTASHVRFFRRYLQDIRGKTVDESAKWHEMTETQLVFHMREFFAGIKKQSDDVVTTFTYFFLTDAAFCKCERVIRVTISAHMTSFIALSNALTFLCKH